MDQNIEALVKTLYNKALDTLITQHEELIERLDRLEEQLSNLTVAGSGYQIETYEE